ncbi:DUF4190 domain-containing protein [Streptomyces caatingaensis]|uniref:DUF4190 domain-containing protein n=1 Tax=Streptomyces caatingaensis TaxID=1678637 RepID=A0A0K9XEV7_9ACTN|nr:DUF4190 domain-containing protein [Streptomyces caatingaensis]KNB51172.1 hypothetical protein AC230_18790 [Streptomyces caatingaensis]
MSGYGQNPYGPPSQPQQPPQQPGYGYPAANSAPYQGGYPAAPPVQPYGAAPYGAPMQPSNGIGTAGLVTGIIGAVCSAIVIFWYIGFILGILGIVFGAVGRGKVKRGEATNRGAATTGIVLGILGIILPVIYLVLFASAIGAAGLGSS